MCSHTPVQPKKHTLCTRTPLQNTESNAGRERRAAHPLCPSSDSLLNFSMGGWNEWTSCTPRGKRSLESRVAHPPTATTDSVSPAAYLTSIRETHQFVLSVCFYAPSPLPFFPLSRASSRPLRLFIKKKSNKSLISLRTREKPKTEEVNKKRETDFEVKQFPPFLNLGRGTRALSSFLF